MFLYNFAHREYTKVKHEWAKHWMSVCMCVFLCVSLFVWTFPPITYLPQRNQYYLRE